MLGKSGIAVANFKNHIFTISAVVHPSWIYTYGLTSLATIKGYIYIGAAGCYEHTIYQFNPNTEALTPYQNTPASLLGLVQSVSVYKKHLLAVYNAVINSFKLNSSGEVTPENPKQISGLLNVSAAHVTNNEVFLTGEHSAVSTISYETGSPIITTKTNINNAANAIKITFDNDKAYLAGDNVLVANIVKS